MRSTIYKVVSALYFLLLNLLLSNPVSATQLSGTYTIDPSGTASSSVFNDFGSAITYMAGTSSRADGGPSNSGTVGVSGAVTFNVASGSTYTLSAALVIPAINGASASNTISFKKNGSGANPVIYGYKGSGSADGIVILIGASYIIFDGIDVQDPSSNTTATTQMEWGYALLRTSTPVGSQYNVIQNSNITLNRTNTNSVGIFGDCYTWSSGSLTVVSVSSASGATSYNGFYKNTITNCFTPIFIRGYSSGSSSQVDLGNDVGSKGGNVISAFGNGSNTSPYSNPYTGAAVNGIMLYQQGDTYYINNNTITLTAADNVSVVVNAISSVAWGVAVQGSNPVIRNNVINMVSTSTASAFTGIANNQGTSNSKEDIEFNVITGVNTTATGAANFIGINIQSTIPSGKYNIDNNEIKNCKVYGTGYFYGISTAGGGTQTSPFSFSGNKIHDNIRSNGSTGDMYLIHNPNGKVALTQANNHIYNNTNNCGNIYGIYNTATTSTEDIHNNLIYNLSTNTSGTCTGIFSNNTCTSRDIYLDSIAGLTAPSGSVYGININAGSTTNIYRNKLYLPNGASAGIILNKITMTSSAPGIISNNFISIGGSSSSLSYGIFDNGGSYHSFYNNSILITNTYSLSSGIFLNASTSGGNIIYENNCVANTGGGYAVYGVSGTGIMTMDYNNYYVSGAYLGVWSSTNCAKLSNWQSSSSFDSKSLSVNPQYKSVSDLHLKANSLARAGTSVSVVTIDIDAKPRHASPTIGANEISPFHTDIGLLSMNAPSFGLCSDSATTLSVNVINFGIDSAKKPVVYAIVKGPTGSGTYTDTIKTTLAYDTVAIANFSKTFNTSAGGTWNFKIYTSLKNDSDRTNDTINAWVTLYSHSPQPSVTGNAICGYGSMKISASRTFKTDSIYWYDNVNGSNLLATGDTFKTPNIAKTTTYFAQERMQVARYSSGPATNGIGSTTSSMATAGIKFNALTMFTIDSATIYPVASGTVNITLTDSIGDQVQNISVPVTLSSSGGGVRIHLGLIISKGNGYTISINDSATGGFYNNTSGAVYPYKVNNILSILNPIGGSSSSTNYSGLYNILIRTGNCGSKLVPVSAVIATPSVFFTNDAGSAGKMNGGTASNPDRICAGSTMIYDLGTSLLNSTYGTAWTVSAKSVKTGAGTISKDTSFTNPNTKNPGKFIFSPKTGSSDSLFIVKITVKTLGKPSCDSTFFRYIYVSPLPKARFGFTNACLGSPIKFLDSSSISSGKVSGWSWDFSDLPSSTLQNPSHTYSKASKYTVTLTAASDFGCVNSVSKVAEQYPFPVTRFGVVPGCKDFATTFTDSSTILSGSIPTHKWIFGDGTTGSSAATTHIYSKSGYYNVRQVIASSFGCKDSLSKKIRILPRPIASFQFVNACVGFKVNFANTSFDSISSGITYVWDFGDGKSSTDQTPQHIYTVNGTYRIKLTAISKTGCTDTVVQYITPNAKPTVNFFHSNGCTGKMVNFSDSGKNGTNNLYNWYFGDASSFSSKSSTVAHSYLKAGSYTVKLRIDAFSGCSDSENVNIIVADPPKADFTAPAACIGKPALFTNTTTPSSGLTYKWNFGDSSAVNTNTNPVHIFLKANSYIIKLNATNSNGCTDSITKILTVNPIPVIQKWTASIHNYTVRLIPKDTTQKTYKWYFGTGDSSSSKIPVYTYPSVPKKYPIKLVVTNAGGCSAFLTDSLFLSGTGINQGGVTMVNDVNVFPNPFEHTTRISYGIMHYSKVIVDIYDLNCNKISMLRDGFLAPGIYEDIFDADKYNIGPGIYIVRMVVDGEVHVKRIENMR
jgi:PKD repeat protein